MKRELELLQEIKKNFGWPVDTIRYGLSGPKRYVNGEESSDELPTAIKERVRFSQEKVKIAKESLKSLTRLQWVQMIFITGSVASLNAEESDDIDIWLVVDSKRIWLTRAIDFALYTAMGKRRLSIDGVTAARVKDKFCFNFYTTTDSLELPRHSISYAMQFVDAMPIFIRSPKIYQQLIENNIWIKEFFPTWYVGKIQESSKSVKFKEVKHLSFHIFIDWILNFLDYIAGVLMLLKSEKKMTLSPQKVFRKQFTTWGTPRILSQYDNKTITEGSQESK